MSKTAIQPTRSENYPEWYQQVIKEAELADVAPVRGCMVMRPWGYGIWEQIQKELDERFKETDHENAYFPLLIPLKYLEKEAEHVEGFAKECAVVTHHKLEAVEGKLIPRGKLEEPLVIRPTSETIIGVMFSKWIRSYRDLPLLQNQWANVMRWEMRTRLFLRTSEFLWQEGHTAHETKEEALEETHKMAKLYADFARDHLAIPVYSGEKTSEERFPGALNTFTIEALMQDGKALQAGTSHFLGQNFAKASEIKFQSREGNEEYVWTTSWGVSTRMIGALIMTHSDDNGLVLPPKVAPQQIIIIPVYRDEAQKAAVLEEAQSIQKRLREQNFAHARLRVKIDQRDLRGGEKNWQHIKKGVPLKIEIGPRDLEKNQVCLVRRDDEKLQKQFIDIEEFISKAPDMLKDIQNNLLQRAQKFRDENTFEFQNVDEIEKHFKNKTGFASISWSEEAQKHPIYDTYKLSNRCILGPAKNEKCALSGAPAQHQVLVAKSY